jgi:beta-lactamase regulating signal transducer with metallopeptidase domain
MIGSWSRLWFAALPLVGNHLWQSTVCLAVVALLTLTVRNNQAHVRHRLWLAASIKFLIPIAPLMAIGRRFAWHAPATGRPTMSFVVDTMSQPFSGAFYAAAASPAHSGPHPVWVSAPMLLLSVWLAGCAAVLLTWLTEWWRVARTLRRERPMHGGREVTILHRLQRIGGLKTPIAIVTWRTSFEPGVFGIAKPVLLWPRGLSERLDDDQLEAILAHEVCHVWRRDNLTVAVHMVVEAVFWFHPLVWWLEQRLMHERERACDEAVIRWGVPAPVYAESIIKTCEFCVASPFVYVPGATDSDLNARIEAIMNMRRGEALRGWRKLLLAATGVIAVVGPVAVGVLNAPRVMAQSPMADATVRTFVVASVNQPSTPLSAFDVGRHRLVTLLFDTRTQGPEDVARAVDAAKRWVSEKMAPSDLVAVATAGSSIQVLTAFTSSKAEVTSVLCALSVAATDHASPADTSTPTTEAFTERRPPAHADFVVVSSEPLKGFIQYFSAGISRRGTDLRSDLRAVEGAAVHANVAMFPMAIYPIDSRNLPAIVPGDNTTAACAPPK